jgi:hypothetical protein
LEAVLAGEDKRPNSATFATLFQRFDLRTTGVPAWQVSAAKPHFRIGSGFLTLKYKEV